MKLSFDNVICRFNILMLNSSKIGSLQGKNALECTKDATKKAVKSFLSEFDIFPVLLKKSLLILRE